MQCTVQWEGKDAQGNDGMAVTAHTETGHTLRMDGAPASAPGEPGGHNLAPRPMELLLAGTGGCTAFDVVAILKKGRHAVTGCEVSLTAERAETDPKVFTHIHFHFRVTGKGLKPEVVTRAINLSKEKYCSASIMLGETAKITHDFEIVEAA